MPSADYLKIKAAFEAAEICVADPLAEISFRQGCAQMGFSRQSYQIALRRQQTADAFCEISNWPRLAEPHWNGRAWLFYVREVEAYVAAKRGE